MVAKPEVCGDRRKDTNNAPYSLEIFQLQGESLKRVVRLALTWLKPQRMLQWRDKNALEIEIVFATSARLWCNSPNFPQGGWLGSVKAITLTIWPFFSTLEKFDMKKSLIALAALAATGAFAQSSVTLYGVADLSITRSKTDGMAATTGLSNGGTINDGDSRIGLRGTEDLGGGVKASFNFEQFLDLENGQSRTDQGAGDSLWHRAAWMSLSGGFGSLRLGRSLTPNFYGVAAWDLTGTANYSTAVGKFGVAGPTRLNSHIAYTTPNFGGFSATLGTTLKDDNGTSGRALSANAVYSNGPLGVGLSYSKIDSLEASKGLGAQYKFGPVTVAAAFMDPAGDVKGFNIGAGVDLGPVNVTLEGARDTGSAKKTTDYALTARYPFSKRTFAYGGFYHGETVNVGTKTNSFGLGVRHNF